MTCANNAPSLEDDADDDNNPYVQELKRVFDSCGVDGSDSLGQPELVELCDKLHLAAHREYILAQVLPYADDNESRVTFPLFRRRFVQLLPEIVDFSNSTNPPPEHPTQIERQIQNEDKDLAQDDDTSNDILSDFSEDLVAADTVFAKDEHVIDKTLRELALTDDGYLGRYETRLICQHTSGLGHLTPSEIGGIFASLDKQSTGRISVESFKRAFGAKMQPVCVSPPSQTNTPFRRAQLTNANKQSTCILFTAIDTDNTGKLNVDNLLDYWITLGISDARKVLQVLGFGNRAELSSVDLSESLEHELLESSMASEILMVAFLTFKAELEHVRWCLTDSRSQSEHLLNQLQATARRHSILVEEMDHNQHSLETQNRDKMMELDVRYRTQIEDQESKYRAERDAFCAQLNQLDDELRTNKQTETTTRNRNTQLEKENNRLKKEGNELTSTIKEMETLNREMRMELERATLLAKKSLSQHGSDRVGNEGLWKHRAELMALQNKRLKDRLDELTSSPRQKQARTDARKPALNVSHCKPSAGFQRELIKLKRRRKLRGDSLSEFESDLEPIILRPRMKRPLPIKERRKRSERRYKRQVASNGGIEVVGSASSSSENMDKPRSIAEEVVLGQSLTGEQLKRLMHRRMSEERKQLEHQMKMELAETEVRLQEEKHQLTTRFEREKQRLREQWEREMGVLLDTAKRSKEDAVKTMQHELTEKYEQRIRDIEIKFASEKNVMERAFAEDKMESMARLQEDFERELRRAREASASSGTLSNECAQVEELSKKVKVLESSLDGQRNGYECKLQSLRSDYERRMSELVSRAESGADWMTAEDLPQPLQDQFYILLGEAEKRHGEKQQEKHTLVKEHANQIEQLETQYSAQLSSAREQLSASESLNQSLSADFGRLSQTRARLDEALTELASLREECAQLRAPRTNATRHVQTDQQGTSAFEINSIKERQRCGRCQMLVGRMLDLEELIQNEVSGESGIEEMDSSAESAEANFEPVLLKRENHKLRHKLKSAREKLLDLRLCLALSSSQEIRLNCAHEENGKLELMHDFGGPHNSRNDKEQTVEHSLAKELERLREENFLLEARLNETKTLLDDTVAQLQAQLRETSRLGSLIQSLWNNPGSGPADDL